MMTIKESPAYKYAKWAADESHRKTPQYVKKQAAAWLDIVNGNHDKACVNNKAFRKIEKIMRLMIHPDLNVPMTEGLEPYMWLLIIAVFCTEEKETGFRWYKTAVLEIARKNFKTFVSAVIFIIAMLTEPRFSRFFSVAPDLKLSKELQNAIRKIIKSSPALADPKVFKTLRSEVRCCLTESEYTPLAYSEDRLDGKLANMFLSDEAGDMDSYPTEAMRSSQITLRNKLGIIISTQYPKDNNGFDDEIDIAKKVLDGLSAVRVFALLYEPDIEFATGDIWQTNDICIYQANPVAARYDYIFDDLKEKRELAVLYENRRANFLCKHLNIKYKSLGVEGYVDIAKVKMCAADEDLEFWRGRGVYLGLDLSQTDDNTSVAMLAYDSEKDVIRCKAWGFIPADRIEIKTRREGVDYKAMIRRGEVFACGDEIIDYKFVEDFILSLKSKYGVEPLGLGFDRYNAISSIQKIEAASDPIECVEIRQHSSVLHPATKLLRERILQKKFIYDKSTILEINFQNARCTEDTNRNKYVNKKKSSGKVDVVVSIINAVYLLNANVLLDNDDFFIQG